MTEAKFKPGPWRTALADDTLILDGEGNQVAETLGDYGPDYQRMEANAHLIAAAPEMYEALQDALWAIDNMAAILTAHGLTGTLTDPTPAIRAALTKARGGKQ